MNTRIAVLTTVALIAVLATSCSSKNDGSSDAAGSPGEARGASGGGSELRVAVVTGGHAFDVPGFYQMLRELPGVDAYPQHLEHFSSSSQEIRDAYDAVVFYGMDQGVPEEEGRRAAGNPRAAIERITAQGQGVVVLHHALLAWEKWDFWNQLTGFDNRNFSYKEGLSLSGNTASDQHAVTQDLDDFEILDEGYVLKGDYDAKGTILLTVQHDNSMEQVAWARQHGKSRVFCLALGHDDQSWSNPGFLATLQRGIAWSASTD